jgi:hypothetical protein
MRHVVLVVVALVAGAAGGALSLRALGEAHADPADVIVVPVPSQGVVFRASGGNVIARVRSDAAGGVFEVLDAREQVAVRLRATPSGGTIDVSPARMPLRPALPLARSVDDPGY